MLGVGKENNIVVVSKCIHLIVLGDNLVIISSVILRSIFLESKKSIVALGIAASSKLQVLYCPRDYRGEGASASDWKEVTVHSRTEIKILPKGSTKARKYKLSSVISLSLSA